MLLPLMLNGGGRFSLDQLIRTRRSSAVATTANTTAWGLVMFGIGVTLSLLLPWAGGVLAIAGIALMTWSRRRTSSAGRLVTA